MKYRKKPVIVEALQWFEDGYHYAVCTDSSHPPAIHTRDGDLNVMPGDWIITDENGEHSVCKPNVFEKTYEKVERWDLL